MAVTHLYVAEAVQSTERRTPLKKNRCSKEGALPVVERVSQAAAVVTKAETGERASPKESSNRSAGPFTLEDDVIRLTLEARVTRTREVQTSETELLQRLPIKGSTPPQTGAGRRGGQGGSGG